MPSPRSVLAIATLVLTGCPPAWAPLANMQRGNTDVASVPSGDGSHYVSVTVDPPQPPAMVQGQWRREAHRTCDGEYLVLSESGVASRKGGGTAAHVHEGYVHCLSPEAGLAERGRRERK